MKAIPRQPKGHQAPSPPDPQAVSQMRREYNPSAQNSWGNPMKAVRFYKYWFQQVLRVISVMKHEYNTRGLTEKSASADPFELFRIWFEEAVRSKVLDPNAMTLGTLGKNSSPALRTVLLKGFDPSGFVFYTNYESQKGREIDRKGSACLLFYWPTLVRQVRIDGRVQKVSAAESDEYFQSRPRGSQLSAWASRQSRSVPGRETLEKQMAAFERKFKGKPVPRPPHWGGYRLVPHRFEFWNGRPNRLHDRLCYTKSSSGKWFRERLSP